MNKKVIIKIISILIILGLGCIVTTNLLKNREKQTINRNESEIKTNKDNIYELFNNFLECNNIYYISKNLYSERSIGPTIYQIDILAELTDKAYEEFINQVEFEDLENFEIKVNPNNINYQWKKIMNIKIIESKDIEDASISKIYLDEKTKTIYIIALGGN